MVHSWAHRCMINLLLSRTDTKGLFFFSDEQVNGVNLYEGEKQDETDITHGLQDKKKSEGKKKEKQQTNTVSSKRNRNRLNPNIWCVGSKCFL